MAAEQGFLERARLNYVDGAHETRNVALKWLTLSGAVGLAGVGWAWLVAQATAGAAAFDQFQIWALDRKGEVAKRRSQEKKTYWTGFDWGSLNPLRSGRNRVNQPTLRTALIGV